MTHDDKLDDKPEPQQPVDKQQLRQKPKPKRRPGAVMLTPEQFDRQFGRPSGRPYVRSPSTGAKRYR